MKFLFLYTEIADYFLSCCHELSKNGEVHVVRWPVNKEAPFHFSNQTAIKLYNKNDYSYSELQNLVNHIKPDIIVCSGWIDKDYLKISKQYNNKIPTVLTCDTHWRGTLKQQLAVLLSRFTLLKIFSHAWVPGITQKTYVEKLGFSEKQIQLGFYSCNHSQFEKSFQKQYETKKNKFPHKFIYVGRYHEFKGLKDLWEAFIELHNEQPNNWELWCLGTGDLKPIEHTNIKHFGFVQPQNLNEYIAQTGVFILPSRFEPWGVVVHEFAAAGFPLILSSAVGAKELFLKDGENGYLFEPSDKDSLKKALKNTIAKSDEQLTEMGILSNQLSQAITPEKWASTLLSILKNH